MDPDPSLILGRVNCDSHAISIKVPHINGRLVALRAEINRIIAVAVSLGRESFAILQCIAGLHSVAMPSLISPNVHVSRQAQHVTTQLDNVTRRIYIYPLLRNRKV